MKCEEGAKTYCRYSWQNGGYTSEAECLAETMKHECPSIWSKAVAFAKKPVVWGLGAVAVVSFIIYKTSK